MNRFFLRIAGVSLMGLMGGAASARAAGPETLVSAELVAALGLDGPPETLPARRPGLAWDPVPAGLAGAMAKEGVTLRRLRLPPPRRSYAIPEGPVILQNELAPVSRFDLLYAAEEGCLIAVFPVLESTSAAGHYMDLSPFCLEVPGQEPAAVDRWAEAGGRVQRYKRSIQAYRTAAQAGKRIRPFSLNRPYVHALLDFDTGRVTLREFEPEEFLYPPKRAELEGLFSSRVDGTWAIFPIFPTVYSPARPDNADSDSRFGSDIYNYMKRLALRPGDKILDAGTGSGYLAWAAWAAARRFGAEADMYALDINPVAVANARVTARLAGFPLTAKVHDNVADAQGRPAFPGARFRFLSWNMPAVPIARRGMSLNRDNTQFHNYWDGGSNGSDTLFRFASAVGPILDPEVRAANGKASPGAAVIWNILPPEQGDVVGEAFRRAGLATELIDQYYSPYYRCTCLIYAITPPASAPPAAPPAQ